MTDENIIVVSSEVMNKRVANFEDQIPNKTMLITQRMEGYKRDIYSIIGRGVSEDVNTKPAITESTGFNVVYVGAEPGNGSALHTHPDEVEVFIPFSEVIKHQPWVKTQKAGLFIRLMVIWWL